MFYLIALNPKEIIVFHLPSSLKGLWLLEKILQISIDI